MSRFCLGALAQTEADTADRKRARLPDHGSVSEPVELLRAETSGPPVALAADQYAVRWRPVWVGSRPYERRVVPPPPRLHLPPARGHEPLNERVVGTTRSASSGDPTPPQPTRGQRYAEGWRAGEHKPRAISLNHDDLELGPVLRLGKDDRAPIAPVAGEIRPPVGRRRGVHGRDRLGEGSLGRDRLGPDGRRRDGRSPGHLVPDHFGADEDLALAAEG